MEKTRTHVQTHIRLDTEMYEKIRKRAFNCRVSINQIAREAISEYIGKAEKKAASKN